MIPVSRETADLLDHFRRLVIAENATQNLIAPSTIDQFDRRHLDDSLQLARYCPGGPLLDIGSGAGLPGIVLACCRDSPTHLVEPRTKRAAFLTRTVSTLGIGDRVTVHHARVERLVLPPMAVITARAVAALDTLFAAASHLSDNYTRWVLPKGRSAAIELEAARATWQGDFRLMPSVTDPEAAIVLAQAVRRKGSR